MSKETKSQPVKIPTRMRLMLAAEHLFSEKGLDQVTTKEILTEAQQRNESALQYHFGSRVKLLSALIEMRVKDIDERRVEMLDEMEAGGKENVNLRDVVSAAIRPLAERIYDSEQRRFIILMSYVVADPRFEMVENSLQLEFAGIRRCRQWMQTFLKDLPSELAEMRMRMVIELGVGVMGSAARELAHGEARRDTRLFIEQLIDTITAHLQAPPSAAVEKVFSERR